MVVHYICSEDSGRCPTAQGPRRAPHRRGRSPAMTPERACGWRSTSDRLHRPREDRDSEVALDVEVIDGVGPQHVGVEDITAYDEHVVARNRFATSGPTVLGSVDHERYVVDPDTRCLPASRSDRIDDRSQHGIRSQPTESGFGYWTQSRSQDTGWPATHRQHPWLAEPRLATSH
jgi:hypothetical protein